MVFDSFISTVEDELEHRVKYVAAVTLQQD